jgi:hypothetical protein
LKNYKPIKMKFCVEKETKGKFELFKQIIEIEKFAKV